MSQYKKTLEFLEKGFKGRGIKLGLERVSVLAKKLGNPQKSFRSVIIGGTNGKGSISAMLASIINKTDLKTGLYTSPHLFDVRERIAISGEKVGEKDFATAVDKVRSAGVEEITYYECLTLAAFVLFEMNEVQSAVLEVGLGGRLDAVNIAESEVSIITGIAIDHTEHLGSSIEEIAFEKSGIIRRGGVVIAGRMPGSAFNVIKRESRKRDARLIVSGKDFSTENVKFSAKGFTFDYLSEEISLRHLKVPLCGSFQPENAPLAVSAFLQAAKRFDRKLDVDGAVRKGLSGVRWRGRMEKIKLNCEILFDCAHNSDALRYLASYLSQQVSEREVILIFGVLSDKDIPLMLSMLSIRGIKIIFTYPDNQRAESPEELKKIFPGRHIPVSVIYDPVKAIKKAMKESSGEGLICVAGSIYLVAPLLNYVDALKKKRSKI